jgi:hydrogenase-4 membrane subunit HyfE
MTIRVEIAISTDVEVSVLNMSLLDRITTTFHIDDLNEMSE